jgi:hypothetical protein
MNKELMIIKDIVEMETSEYVKVTVAEKPNWLLIKTVERLKTIGCIRLNKNSFITLYIDTKEGVLLEKELLKIEGFTGVDIKSRPTGNFTQNKIKLFSETQIDLVTKAINYVFEKDIVKLGKRVRNKVNGIA